MAANIRELTFGSANGQNDIYAKVWEPEGRPRAVVQLAHGMAEHVERYHDFGLFLSQHGILLAANDHAGHGRSALDEAHLGFFRDQDGWSALVDDLKTLHDIMAEAYPGVPYVMMGHSMGSFLARSYAARYPSGIAAFVFSGTAGRNPAVGLGKRLARLERRRNGPMQPSPLLDKISFGAYNRRFSPARTKSDWLSRDTAQVDQYVADPLCGFIFTAEGMLDLFNGLGEISNEAWAAKVPNVPILLFSGDADPVGNYGKGVMEVVKWLKDTGHQVELTLYPGGRHEMLNEINRTEVYQDVLSFIGNVLQY